MAAALALALVATTPFVASAHERRVVGKYSFLVGFNAEPAIQGEMNAVQLTVTVPTEDARGVPGLADTLKVNVSFGGGQPKEFSLRPIAATPGRYIADFIPTRDGSYVFNFIGTVEGLAVNERFESGPGRFNDVEPVSNLQFPDKVPLANDATRLAQGAADQVAEAQAAASSAKAMAMGGIIVGILSLLLGVGALVTATSRRV